MPPLLSPPDGASRCPARLRRVLSALACLVCLACLAGAGHAAPALSFTDPVDGGIVHSRSFPLTVTTSGYEPPYVTFYQQIGYYAIPFDVAARATDGTYHSGFSVDDDGYAYLGARDTDGTAHVDVKIGVDTRTGPASLALSPADGATVRSTTVTLRAVPTNFNPKRVEFYQGDPSDAIIDLYLGRAEKATDGSYSLPVTFQNGYHTLYALYANDLYSVQSPLSTIAVDTRTGPTSIAITGPADGSTVKTQQVTITASATNFVPDAIELYEKAPGGATIDAYLGKAPRQTDGTYALPVTLGIGTHTLYGVVSDGFDTLHTPDVHVTVDTATGPPALAMTDPVNGTTVRSRDVTLRATSVNFQPSGVSFYLGDPSDAYIDQYVGNASRAADGSYSLPVQFGSDGLAQVYVTATYGNQAVTSPLDTFTIDTRTGPTSLAITNPIAGSTTVTKDVTLRAAPTNFTPKSVTFYEGDPTDGVIDSYLGNGTRDADGQFSLPVTFSVGSHTVYATSNDGFSGLTAPVVTFQVENAAPVSLAVTSPANGGTVTTRNLTLVAQATNFTPASVGFYVKGTGGTIDTYLGDANRGTDGSYALPVSFGADGTVDVYVQANNGQALETSPTVSFTISTGLPNATLAITNPGAGSTQATSLIGLVATSANFQPASVSFYETTGPDTIDAFLGSANRGTDGKYTKPQVYFANGSHTIYAEATNGSAPVRSATVTFSVSAKLTVASLSVDAQSVASCATATGTVTLSGPAPAGGAVVALSSTSPALTLPGSVTVPAGQTSAAFPITGETVRDPVSVTLTASYNGTDATATLTVSPTPRAAYYVEDLGTLGGTYSTANGINASGQVVGVSTTAAGQVHGFLTDANGRMRDLDPTNANDVYPYAVNDADRVAGYFKAADGSRTAFRSDASGALAPLPSLGGTQTRAFSINTLGQVTGYSKTASGDDHAFRVDANGAITDLSVLGGGKYSYGFGINDAGQVAGYSDTSAGDTAYLTQPDGDVSAATMVGADYYAYAYAVNGAGLTTGEYWRNGTDLGTHLFRGAPDGTVSDLGGLGDHFTTGEAINSRGDIAGYAYDQDAQGGEVLYHAVVCPSGGTLQDLNTLIDPASGWVLQAAHGINDRGQIVGIGERNGVQHAFRLTPNAAPFPYGDANGDGAVDLKDVTLLLKAAAGLQPIPDWLAGDVAPAPTCSPRGFGDGRITVADAARVLRKVRGLEPVWP